MESRSPSPIFFFFLRLRSPTAVNDKLRCYFVVCEGEVVAVAIERAGFIFPKVETHVRSCGIGEDMPVPPPSLLVVGLGPTGVEVALAIAESGRCCLRLGDDAVASTEWRKSASCLLQRRPTADSDGAGKAMKRSQFLSAVLAPLSTQSITAISPVGDASIVERFDVVIMTDPTLPHAIAFSEHVSSAGTCSMLALAPLLLYDLPTSVRSQR